ncbi:hypothetical protein BDA96_01G558400 [Sorghum bicolor]|uniref:Uncharacterized protein n=2 Tax=Sorghum bicolor TaxID=4558 RepID=A0A921S9I1_SORBI|nr:hypothetical protein BDA96_01G558400 [Sorghum bicolor]KXG40285.1 hypothetical protein SORBI_3001G523100 [Sorghum bicolor]
MLFQHRSSDPANRAARPGARTRSLSHWGLAALRLAVVAGRSSFPVPVRASSPSGSSSRCLLTFPRASGQRSQHLIHRSHRSSSTTPVKPSDGLPAPSLRTPLPCTVLTCYTWTCS